MTDANHSEPPQLAPGQLLFRMHAPDTDRGEDAVEGEVFAKKILDLIQALKAADGSINGKRRHNFFIAKLRSSSPTATFEERFRNWQSPRLDTHSAVAAFSACANAIIEGRADQARKYGRCVEFISKLGTGAKKSFEYAEIWVSADKAFRVDSFLSERALAVINPEMATAGEDAGDECLFSGVSFGSFDGTVQVADLRGNLPAIKLILSAGHKQIDCICRADDIEKIRTSLNRRVRVFGRAIYDGRSQLPRRIEVADFQSIPTNADFTRWRGSFRPFEIDTWDGDA